MTQSIRRRFSGGEGKTAPARPVRWRPAPGVGLVLGLALMAVGGHAVPLPHPLLEREGTGVLASPGYTAGDDDLVTEEVFQSHLPTTLEKDVLRFSVNPHLGDWQEKDHMRVTTTLRYGLTKTCEVSLASNLYFSHGHGNIPAFDDYGAANLKPGIKFNLGEPLFAGWETGMGVDYESPIGHPAPELTDGLRHLRSYLTFSHRLECDPHWRIFTGVRIDSVRKTSVPGEYAKHSFQDESSTGITGGFVVDRDNLHYTLELSYDTTRLIGHSNEDSYEVRPGVLWEVPKLRNHKLKSNWVIGCSVNDTYGPGGNSVGASFKVRYNRNIPNPWRHRPAPAPAAEK